MEKKLKDLETNVDNKEEIIEEEISQDTMEEEVKEALDDATQLQEELIRSEDESKQLLNKLHRLAAEFDNFKKRTSKEKENLYTSAVVDVVSSFLPVVDSLERALKASGDSLGEDDQCIREGVQMVYRQMTDILKSLDVKAIEAVGNDFNPEFHEAVMHVEDEDHGEGEVIEEFQKGYIYKEDIVVRHSMVKVAN